MPGDDSQEACMYGIIASGSAAIVSYPRGEDEVEDDFIGGEFAGDEFGGEEEEYVDLQEEEEQPVAAVKGKNKKKKAAADKAEPRINYRRESEFGQLLEEGQEIVRRAQALRPRVQDNLYGAR